MLPEPNLNIEGNAGSLTAGTPAHHWQQDIRGLGRRAVDPLRGLDEILFRRLIDTWNEFLWIPVNQREPGGLDLHYDAMSLAEHVVAIAKRHVPQYWDV